MKNGGPAFPKVGETGPGGQYIWPEDGMTLRDYFAAQAMQGILSASSTLNGRREKTSESVADAAYAVADAMIAERDKQ